MEVRAARLPRRLNGFESRQKGVLGEVLALLPIAGEPVDHLKHQPAIVMNERLDRLGRRLGIDTHHVALPLLNVLITEMLAARIRDNKNDWINEGGLAHAFRMDIWFLL